MRLETHGPADTILLVNGGRANPGRPVPSKEGLSASSYWAPGVFLGAGGLECQSRLGKASDHNIVCEKVGPEVVDSRPTVKYQNKGASDEAAAAVWIDVPLKY
jgi:hypothetical protein